MLLVKSLNHNLYLLTTKILKILGENIIPILQSFLLQSLPRCTSQI